MVIEFCRQHGTARLSHPSIYNFKVKKKTKTGKKRTFVFHFCFFIHAIFTKKQLVNHKQLLIHIKKILKLKLCIRNCQFAFKLNYNTREQWKIACKQNQLFFYCCVIKTLAYVQISVSTKKNRISSFFLSIFILVFFFFVSEIFVSFFI